MDHSLSLETKFKWNCKTNYSCASLFVQEVPRIKVTKIWHNYICHIAKYAKYIYMSYSLPNFKMHLKCFQITRPAWWLPSTLNKLSKYINFIKFGVGMIPQLIVLPNVLLIGIFMPLIKIPTKDFENIK